MPLFKPTKEEVKIALNYKIFIIFEHVVRSVGSTAMARECMANGYKKCG
jgi:hypothetical protein